MTCVNNNGIVWSYNQGVALGGLVELSEATADPTLITLRPRASPTPVLLAELRHARLRTGILVDHGVSGGDAPQFKGVFLRNLMALYVVAPSAPLKSFTDANAESICDERQQ